MVLGPNSKNEAYGGLHFPSVNPHDVSANASRPARTGGTLSDNSSAHLHNAVVTAGQQEPGVSSSRSAIPRHPEFVAHVRQPSSAGLGLHLQTDFSRARNSSNDAETRGSRSSLELGRSQLFASPSDNRRTSLSSRRSLDQMAGVSSPPSSVSSPALGSLNDITPLPSPIVRSGSPEIWKRVLGRRRGSSGSSLSGGDYAGLLPPSALSPTGAAKKKRGYPNLSPPSGVTPISQDTLNIPIQHRSISEFVPDPLLNVRPRNVTDPTRTQTPVKAHDDNNSLDTGLHREQFLAGHRRHQESQDATRTLPTPPPSNKSLADSDEGDERPKDSREPFEVIRVRAEHDGKDQKWQPLRLLGTGAFSQVFLATDAVRTPAKGSLSEQQFNVQDLVAIKVVSHTQDDGADEERIETGVGREIEVLRNISHPCLPRLLSYDDDDSRAVLVLNFCRGGDMFELASQQREYLTSALIQRLFAELVGAVSYLHTQYIAHRDIKLENVLFNLPLHELPTLKAPQTNPHPLVTLTDLGLCKRIPRPPESPLLAYACGSVDYAAPELLMQQPYDGRSTDMWALGVLLYAMIEGRLPFDLPPGQRRGGNVKHRIARCDWMWCEYGDECGEWVESKGKELWGAREVVEGLLKKVGRGRWHEDMVAHHQWVREGITVEGGLRL